jgi:hypothetical protein
MRHSPTLDGCGSIARRRREEEKSGKVDPTGMILDYESMKAVTIASASPNRRIVLNVQ